MTENRANWFTMRSSMDGGSKNSRNSPPRPQPVELGQGLDELVKPDVLACPALRFRPEAREELHRERLRPRRIEQVPQLVRQTFVCLVVVHNPDDPVDVGPFRDRRWQSGGRRTGSTSSRAGGVGNPWCWARVRRCQNEPSSLVMDWAYFRKFLSMCRSSCQYSPPRRIRDVSRAKRPSDSPRYTKGDRNL